MFNFFFLLSFIHYFILNAPFIQWFAVMKQPQRKHSSFHTPQNPKILERINKQWTIASSALNWHHFFANLN